MYLAFVSRFSRLQRGCVCVCVAAFYVACKLLQFTAVIIMPFWSSWNPYIYLHFFSGEILSSEAPNTPSGSCDRYDTVDLRFGSFSSIPLLFSFFLSFAWSKCHFANHSTVYFPFILAMITPAPLYDKLNVNRESQYFKIYFFLFIPFFYGKGLHSIYFNHMHAHYVALQM